MKTLAKSYLERRGYFVRKAPRKPKVGDNVLVYIGGDWAHNSHYLQKGKIIENKGPSSDYGFYQIETYSKDGTIEFSGAVYAKEILEVYES